MVKKSLTTALLLTISASAAANITHTKVDATNDNTPVSIRYNVWFQDHETMGKRYVSSQNNMIEFSGYTQDGFIPNVKLEIGKSESNLFAYTETDLSAYYSYDLNKRVSYSFGAGISNRFDARSGKPDDAATLEWDALDPYISLGLAYDVESFDGLSLFTSLEKRYNKDNQSISGGTTTEVGARYVFVDKGDRQISAEIGYRRDIHDHEFDVTKTVEDETPPDGGEPEPAPAESSTVTVQENRRMIGDGFYIGVRMTF